MSKIKVLFFILAQITFVGCFATDSSDEFDKQYEQLESQLEDARAAGDQDQILILEKDMKKLMHSLAGIQPQDASISAVGDHHEFISKHREQKLEKITLKSKLNLVFEQFIDRSKLGQDAIVLAEIMHKSCNLWQKEKTACFVEAARLLKCQMQVLTVRPGLLKQYFNIDVPCIEEHLLHDIYVQALYLIHTSPKISQLAADKALMQIDLINFVTDSLSGVLLADGYINFDKALPCVRKSLKKISFYIFIKNFLSLLVSSDGQFIDLIQKYLALEHCAKKASITKKRLLWFEEKAEELINSFLKNELDLQNKDFTLWTNLFVGKIVHLLSDLRVRFYVTDVSAKTKSLQDIYFKHSVIIKDPMFNELALFPEIRGYVSRYERLVILFLSEQQDGQLDFCCELYELLSHFRNRVIAAEPTGGYLWLKEKFGFKCKRVGIEKYFLLMKNMTEVLESIEKVLKPDEGMLQNVIGTMLKPGENPHENNGVVVELLSKASPYLATAIKRCFQGDSSAAAHKKECAAPPAA